MKVITRNRGNESNYKKQYFMKYLLWKDYKKDTNTYNPPSIKMVNSSGFGLLSCAG